MPNFRVVHSYLPSRLVRSAPLLEIAVLSLLLVACGKGGNAHSLDEWWINDHGAEALKFGLLILVAEAGIVN